MKTYAQKLPATYDGLKQDLINIIEKFGGEIAGSWRTTNCVRNAQRVRVHISLMIPAEFTDLNVECFFDGVDDDARMFSILSDIWHAILLNVSIKHLLTTGSFNPSKSIARLDGKYYIMIMKLERLQV